MIIDAHCHMFTPKLVRNVASKTQMVAELCLDTENAYRRLSAHSLEAAAALHNVDACILLPTAYAQRVKDENNFFMRFTNGSNRIKTLATLHPSMTDMEPEIHRIFSLGIRGFKLSSFTQRFDLESPETIKMLRAVERAGLIFGWKPVVVFDTFVAADIYFGANPMYLTTPKKLAQIVDRHKGLRIIAAHMGGLTADFQDIVSSLKPCENLYLDTSNAAHTLREEEFISLLRIHGPDHILFGTDWPWFHYRDEIPLIRSLLFKAGWTKKHVDMVFGANASDVFGL
jgi:predicted TIM-barrel fold metal-dependent hydrolase|uniref:Amidohydrolase-related domain-containing protein n=1 Tax=Desulfomonile tiedjei TaxID=2358 RepID=A0A7C4EUI7_9BACT